MYTIELDVDPVTLGFDTKEVKRKEDGTYIVERKHFHVIVWDPYDDNIGGEAWCPCSHDVFNGANWSHGGHYKIDGGEYQNYSRSRVIDYLTEYYLSRMYGLDFTEEEKRDIGKTCSLVCGNKANGRNCYEGYIKQGYKCRYGSPPEDPYHDPFLPEKFRQMLNAANSGNKA